MCTADSSEPVSRPTSISVYSGEAATAGPDREMRTTITLIVSPGGVTAAVGEIKGLHAVQIALPPYGLRRPKRHATAPGHATGVVASV